LGTSYQIGGAVSWILATFIIVTLNLDWRFSFWVAGIIMLLSGIHYYIRVRNAPEEVGLPTIEEEDAGKIAIGEVREDTHLGFEYTIKSILQNKTVWFASFGLFCLNIVRYGITEWLPYLLASEVTTGDFFPLWKTIAFPIGGTIGAITCTWFSDEYLGRRRMPIISALFIGLAASLVAYALLPPLDWLIGGPLLIIIGFLTFGPHVLLVSTIPMEFGTRKAASTATGFIDGWGYVGSAVTTFGSGVLIGASGPESTFLFWVIMALAGGIVLLFNWKSMPEKKEYF
jgi:OPA family sugar phosphate sensor protein UhpC-like MFS transporter